jgi:2-keto-4-pentenoate hydratase/2-oxohepta-3-ene-1,7-dioic acid hydratase in catechol pathway
MTIDPVSPTLRFELPDGTISVATVRRLLNAGYAGKDQREVQAHIDELKKLGVPVPGTTPTLYPVSPYLAQQTGRIDVQHSETSGEAEWAIVIDDNGRVLITCACDHTDRRLEAFGVAWSKNASPDILSGHAWVYSDIAGRFDDVVLSSWVGEERLTIQEGLASSLLEPEYWLEVLEEREELEPGTVLLSGTIPMNANIDQFADRWGVSLHDPVFGEISLEYIVQEMPAAVD